MNLAMGKLIEAFAALFTAFKTKRTDLEVLTKDRLKFIRRKLRKLRRKLWKETKKDIPKELQVDELINEIKTPIDATNEEKKAGIPPDQDGAADTAEIK